MKPFAKLRGKIAEMGYNLSAVANYLNRSRSYVSNRMMHAADWKIDEAYKVLDLLEIPYEEIFTYFPPNGGVPAKGSKTAS